MIALLCAPGWAVCWTGLGDLERLAGRVRQGTAVPRELLALRELLAVIPHLQTALGSTTAELLQEVSEALDDCPELTALVERAIATGEESDGRVIRRSYSADLDSRNRLHQRIAPLDCRAGGRRALALRHQIAEGWL